MKVFLDMMGKAQLSAGGFIRRAVKSLEIKEAPSVDILTLIREIRGIGRNIEQIIKIVNIMSGMDVSQLQKVLENNFAIEKVIVDSYTTRTDQYNDQSTDEKQVSDTFYRVVTTYQTSRYYLKN